MSDQSNSMPSEMSRNERISQVSERINTFLDTLILEYDLNLAEVVGILEVVKATKIHSVMEDGDL